MQRAENHRFDGPAIIICTRVVEVKLKLREIIASGESFSKLNFDSLFLSRSVSRCRPRLFQLLARVSSSSAYSVEFLSLSCQLE
jgi:hypothetical protein